VDPYADQAGFREVKIAGAYDQALVPMYGKRDGEQYSIGLRVEARHCNYQGIMHGGAIATFLDMAMGRAVGAITGRMRAVTASLAIDYIGTAGTGDWIETTGRVLRVGRRLIVVDCLVHKGGDHGKPQLIARANATFAPIGEPAAEAAKQSAGKEGQGGPAGR
jgi:uncharacterized protein (TIGR00369 family)